MQLDTKQAHDNVAETKLWTIHESEQKEKTAIYTEKFLTATDPDLKARSKQAQTEDKRRQTILLELYKDAKDKKDSKGKEPVYYPLNAAEDEKKAKAIFNKIVNEKDNTYAELRRQYKVLIQKFETWTKKYLKDEKDANEILYVDHWKYFAEKIFSDTHITPTTAPASYGHIKSDFEKFYCLLLDETLALDQKKSIMRILSSGLQRCGSSKDDYVDRAIKNLEATKLNIDTKYHWKTTRKDLVKKLVADYWSTKVTSKYFRRLQPQLPFLQFLYNLENRNQPAFLTLMGGPENGRALELYELYKTYRYFISNEPHILKYLHDRVATRNGYNLPLESEHDDFLKPEEKHPSSSKKSTLAKTIDDTLTTKPEQPNMYVKRWIIPVFISQIVTEINEKILQKDPGIELNLLDAKQEGKAQAETKTKKVRYTLKVKHENGRLILEQIQSNHYDSCFHPETLSDQAYHSEKIGNILKKYTDINSAELKKELTQYLLRNDYYGLQYARQKNLVIKYLLQFGPTAITDEKQHQIPLEKIIEEHLVPEIFEEQENGRFLATPAQTTRSLSLFFAWQLLEGGYLNPKTFLSEKTNPDCYQVHFCGDDNISLLRLNNKLMLWEQPNNPYETQQKRKRIKNIFSAFLLELLEKIPEATFMSSELSLIKNDLELTERQTKEKLLSAFNYFIENDLSPDSGTRKFDILFKFMKCKFNEDDIPLLKQYSDSDFRNAGLLICAIRNGNYTLARLIFENLPLDKARCEGCRNYWSYEENESKPTEKSLFDKVLQDNEFQLAQYMASFMGITAYELDFLKNRVDALLKEYGNIPPRPDSLALMNPSEYAMLNRTADEKLKFICELLQYFPTILPHLDDHCFSSLKSSLPHAKKLYGLIAQHSGWFDVGANAMRRLLNPPRDYLSKIHTQLPDVRQFWEKEPFAFLYTLSPYSYNNFVFYSEKLSCQLRTSTSTWIRIKIAMIWFFELTATVRALEDFDDPQASVLKKVGITIYILLLLATHLLTLPLTLTKNTLKLITEPLTRKLLDYVRNRWRSMLASKSQKAMFVLCCLVCFLKEIIHLILSPIKQIQLRHYYLGITGLLTGTLFAGSIWTILLIYMLPVVSPILAMSSPLFLFALIPGTENTLLDDIFTLFSNSNFLSLPTDHSISSAISLHGNAATVSHCLQVGAVPILALMILRTLAEQRAPKTPSPKFYKPSFFPQAHHQVEQKEIRTSTTGMVDIKIQDEPTEYPYQRLN